MHGIDGRWREEMVGKGDPQVRSAPAQPPAPPSITAADAEELRFSLKDLFIATTVAAVMLALFRSIGIFGAVASFIAAAVISLHVLPKLEVNPVRQRLFFDFIWGVVMPVVCLVFDPFVFKEGDIDLFGMDATLNNGKHHFQIGEWALFGWPFLALQILTLTIVLLLGKRLHSMAAFIAGSLVAGLAAAVVIALILIIPALIGTVIFGIGLLGFTPIFSCFAYYRRTRIMAQVAGESASHRLFVQGFIWAVAVPLAFSGILRIAFLIHMLPGEHLLVPL